MRPRSPEVIKNLQELDPSKWLDSPYLRQADEESLLTLLQRKPEGFKTLLNSSYSFIRDIVLRRDILITILKIRPHYIKLIPVKHLSERLFSIVNQGIEKDTDELSKKLLIDALDVAKQELSDYKDAQTMEIKENTSPSSSTQQDIKTPSDTGDETLPDTPTSPSDELEKPKEVSTEPKVNEESTEKPKEPIVEIETEKESISTKENNNNDIDNPSLDPIIQKVFMDASLGDFTKSLEQKIIAIVTDNNVKTNQEIKELVTQHITQLSNNLTAQQQTLELLQQTLNEPSKALINRFSEESEKVSIRISEINTLLENQYNQAKELSTNFSIVLEKPTQDLYDSLEKEIIHQINNCIINESGIQLQVEEIKNKSIESIENSNQAVKDTANNLIDALTTRYNQQKEIIEKANNFFDKKGLIQNITIIAVFINLLLLFFIFITLLLRG
ncbi:MAG: hypothetical protein E7F27_09780 [Bifidobacterium breve]|jgi:hypothetical protein|nr:MAG: hypothetical protein Q620_VSAPLC00001G0005 [Veillonella sp. DORA_A_3_16_22]MDU3416313.1 hypothetical protein [Bifidobacterium breve]